MRTHGTSPKKYYLGGILFDGIALFGNKKVYFTKQWDTSATKKILKKYKNIAKDFDRRFCIHINLMKEAGAKINNAWVDRRPHSFPGYKHTEEARKKMSIMRSGNKNPSWQNNPTYNAVHTWIRKNKPKADRCESCGEKKKLEAANISGKYKRDINDFEWLCTLCHMKKDGRYENVKKYSNMAGPMRGGVRTRKNETPKLKSRPR